MNLGAWICSTTPFFSKKEPFPAEAQYNTLVFLPHSGRHEELWREDAVYDVIVVLGYNDRPPVPNRGSAIFMHVARPDFAPTEGCVAMALSDLVDLLADCEPESFVNVNRPV